MKIVADDKIPFLNGVFEDKCEIEYLPGGEIDDLVLKNADALITRTRTKCNASSLEGSKVKMIASATIGFDHIDTEWCANNGIKWTNAPGCNAESVKQYLASVFAQLVIDKGWELKGKKIAVVGVGNVGSRVSSLAKLLGMEVYEVDPPRAETEKSTSFFKLEEIISDVDIISFHTPLTRVGEDATYHLCNSNLLSKMKSTAIVINSSRGEVVDGNALKSALVSEEIEAAVLDVWEHEPNIDKELMDKCWIVTPHIAGYSLDGKANGTMMSIRAISRHFNLGMDDWLPQNIPEPKRKIIELDCEYLSVERALSSVLVHTYPIKEDDLRLRMNIKGFEKQRGAYPIRREFKAFDVVLTNGNKELVELLKSLGFKNVKLLNQ
ncbi:4-phosphoerythronate dehydrogenase [Carboxylicivirga sp. N1Y90]|uniref:4-phosphoerythronate dehydrogenase n=1 Tax=Carboxylicivirga fragile TaxID=3417571 RepID=UPI003D32544B|nr:4-phosphoerythronate dehydrogenase [Marinilabiliaceae bacterium N1Y90]